MGDRVPRGSAGKNSQSDRNKSLHLSEIRSGRSSAAKTPILVFQKCSDRSRLSLPHWIGETHTAILRGRDPLEAEESNQKNRSKDVDAQHSCNKPRVLQVLG